MPDRRKDSLKIQIDELSLALRRLEAYSLPVETRTALSDARRLADALGGEIAESQEQSRLAALYRVSQALGESLDLESVLKQVMDALISLTGAERGFIVLRESERSGAGSLWQVRAARNYQQENLSTKDQETSRTVIQSVIQSGQGIVTTDARSDPRFALQESVIFLALRSILCAPLFVRGQVVGAVYVDNRAQVGIFTEEDLRLLSAFAVQAGIAIENARLYTRTDQALAQRVAELETLSQIDRELNADLNLSNVLEICRGWAERGVRVSRAEVWLKPAPTADGKVPGGAAGEAGLDPLYRAALDGGGPQVMAAGKLGKARLVVPILHGAHSLGVIAVERESGFTAEETLFLSRLAARSSAAIQNARLYQAVQEANTAKSKFVSVVTHELRIPMTSIKGYTDLLRQGVIGPLNDQQQSFLGIIRSNVDRMSALVSDLADISRIETGRLKLECRALMLGPEIDETVRSLRARMDEKRQQVEVSLEPDLPQVYADPNRVVQVLTNLVSNAWKYTPEGGRVRIRAQRQGDRVLVQVQDSGIGISPEDQQKLFSQFFRSEDPAVREQQGWGLGLNITRRLIVLMGGTVGLSSALGQGSTFWFTLPIA